MQLSRYLPLTSLSSLRPTSLPSLWRPYTTSRSPSSQNQPQSTSQQTQPEEPSTSPLGLPEPSSSHQTLDINSKEGLRFDALGPIVVNKDGTMSRITNWDKMAQVEKDNTLRILGKRNKARLAALKKDGVDVKL